MGKVVVVSACLMGIPCAYDGKSRVSNSVLEKLVSYEAIIAVCPEILGGLKVPRKIAELSGGDGSEVLSGKAKVIDMNGNDITKNYLDGALKALEVVKRAGAEEAFLREGSPSCGVREIYDGTFSHTKRKGKGVFSALLELEGIKLIGVGKERWK